MRFRLPRFAFGPGPRPKPGTAPAEQTGDAVTDPDSFIEFCFRDPTGRPIRQAAVHSDLQRFLSDHRHALVELPRDHGKSMQVCARLVWELGRAPGLRVKLVCATAARAAERSAFLRQAVADNARVRAVFPRLTPAHPWGGAAFSVGRPAAALDPSVTAVGVNTSSTGGRADLLVCDDVVDAKALHSRPNRQKVKDLFRHNLMNLLEPDGRVWCLFTPWHADDLNADLKAGGAYPLFRRAVGPDLEPVWPEKWPAEALAVRRAEIGPASFARGFQLQNADEGERLIRPEWVTFWRDEMPREAFDTVLLAIDPAVSAKPTADATGLVVVGRLSGSNEVRVLAAEAVRATATDLIPHVSRLDDRWRPDRLLYEANGAFEAVRRVYVHTTAFGPRLEGVTAEKHKAARVHGLSVSVQNTTVKLRGGVGDRPADGQRELFDEMTAFPFAPHDDLVDALATAVDAVQSRRDPKIWVL